MYLIKNGILKHITDLSGESRGPIPINPTMPVSNPYDPLAGQSGGSGWGSMGGAGGRGGGLMGGAGGGTIPVV